MSDPIEPVGVNVQPPAFADEFAEIEMVPPEPVKIKLDMGKLKWGDVISLQRAIAGGADGDQGDSNVQMIATIMNKVLVGATVDDLPIMTFQRVMKFVMNRMQSLADQGN